MNACKAVGKATGAVLTVAGVIGLAISAIYWFDLDDKMVAKTDEFLDKAGKMKEMKRMKEEYEAAQNATA
jgi:hypothetical protein